MLHSINALDTFVFVCVSAFAPAASWSVWLYQLSALMKSTEIQGVIEGVKGLEKLKYVCMSV